MLKWQALASYFMFVSFPPYGTFTVVTFVTRSFSDADRTQNEVLGAYRIESRYRLSTAKSSSAKRMAIRFWTHSRREGAFILLSEENKNPNPSPIEKRFGFSWFGAPPGTRTLSPLIKRNQRATIVNFRNYANSSFLAFCRKLAFCIRCILCTCCSLLHPLSSRSGVQKCAEPKSTP